jgi:hypothetical protein
MGSTLYAYVLLSLLHFTCLTTAYSVLPKAICQRQEVISRQYMSAEPNNGMDVVARRIIVVGAVHGGYYRACVKNEVRERITCNLLYMDTKHRFLFHSHKSFTLLSQ